MKYLTLFLALALSSLSSLALQDSSLVVKNPISEDLAVGPGFPYYYGNEGVITYWSASGTQTREDFSSPLYLTFTVEKQLKKKDNGRWNIGFGFGVLNVKSELAYQNEFSSVEQKIRRTYGVIPIYAKYNFIQKEKFRAFATAGFNAEFGMNGRIEHTETFANGTESSFIEKFPLGLGHANVNSGLGVSYSPFNKLSITAELNAARYFEDQWSSVIWNEKSVWVRMKTGVALQF